MKKIIQSLSLVVLLFLAKTYHDLRPVDDLYWQVMRDEKNVRISDRFGSPLSVTYQTEWNYHDQIPLHKFPAFLVEALIASEDQHFNKHHGVDWPAKLAAAWQNVKARRMVRGASTITEQVVHLLTKRPRTLWSKWLELIEAHLLERKLSKNHILEFYLNQVPFASNRHGLLQASRYYFNRDLTTLTLKEILSLIILIKSPSSYDLRKSTDRVEKRLPPLVTLLINRHIIAEDQREKILLVPLRLERSSLDIHATHFVAYLRRHYQSELHLLKQEGGVVRTTLDGELQNHCQRVLDQRVDFLNVRRVHNGAILIMDHQSGEIVAWVVAGGGGDRGINNKVPSAHIDGVTAMRQPGSLLKPFIYAMALEKGWRPTTLIIDEPLAGPVGSGMHKFRNYSNHYYGPVTIREALANSLNVPAVKTIQFVGVEPFLHRLYELGFTSLKRGADIYEDGLALGNGEVTLIEMVRAYGALANKGVLPSERLLIQSRNRRQGQPIFSPENVSLIGDILSDPWARRLEFGSSSVLNIPVQTAVKTGTSSDYRDAWIVGYNHRYVVGIWMGNLNNQPMDGITGSIGPAVVLRSIFAHLNRDQIGKGLPVAENMAHRDVCIRRTEGGKCVWHTELFGRDEDLEQVGEQSLGTPALEGIHFQKPTPGLKMAMDPRIPVELQKFELKLNYLPQGMQARWIVDGQEVAMTEKPTHLWPLQLGHHRVKVQIFKGQENVLELPEVGFIVK